MSSKRFDRGPGSDRIDGDGRDTVHGDDGDDRNIRGTGDAVLDVGNENDVLVGGRTTTSFTGAAPQPGRRRSGVRQLPECQQCQLRVTGTPGSLWSHLDRRGPVVSRCSTIGARSNMAPSRGTVLRMALTVIELGLSTTGPAAHGRRPRVAALGIFLGCVPTTCSETARHPSYRR